MLIEARCSTCRLLRGTLLLAFCTFHLKGQQEWVRQFGTNQPDSQPYVALDDSGVYVAGSTFGAFPGQTNAGSSDIYLRKFDRAGQVLWTVQYGTFREESVTAVATASSSVYILALGNGPTGGTPNTLILKYDRTGSLVWVRTIEAQFSIVARA